MAKVESFRGFPKPVFKKNTKGEPRALMAYVKVNGKQWAKEFPLGTRASVIIAWQEEEFERRQTTADVVAMPGTFAGDVQRYLDLDVITDMPSFKARRSDINAWVREFGNTRRDEIKAPAVNKAMAKWKAAGIAANTRRHRLTALNDLWLKLDKREAPWTDEVKAPKKPRSIPQAHPYEVIISTLNHMEPSLAKACALIMAFCGFRPEEIRRTQKWMVTLDGDRPQVIRNTAKGGHLSAVSLVPEAILGWQMFGTHGGWEASLADINRDWKAAMKRAGFSPVKIYTLVHSFCTQLYASTGDLQMVQMTRGHADIRTTLVYTQIVADPRLAPAMKKAFGADQVKR
jgi:site-specific recombinase XerC